jgi:drug/metabolite transporter superfamily protein YnfA
VGRRAWLVFAAVQIVGCIFASYGTVYSESAFVRGSWVCGFLLLLPGNLPAMALDQKFVHVRAAYIFFPVAVGCNALLWLTCSAVWRILRRDKPWITSHRYAIAFAAMGLVFVVANTVHFLRPVTCYDCFYTEYHSRFIRTVARVAVVDYCYED